MSSSFDASLLSAAGLNLHAVFNLASLPEAVRAPLAGHDPRYRQLILIGHAGRRLWDAVQAANLASADPIDDFTLQTVRQWAAGQLPGGVWEAVYPDHHRQQHIGLQALGELAGWHHQSPFMVGVNQQWGSWFAYRAVVLADSDFAPTPKLGGDSPCLSCVDQPCITACPGKAMADGRFSLRPCLDYRKSSGSGCRDRCLARIACPVASEHRYPDAQTAHAYLNSLRMIALYD